MLPFSGNMLPLIYDPSGFQRMTSDKCNIFQSIQRSVLTLLACSPAEAPGPIERGESIHSMTTEAWQEEFEADGYVDLWVQEEFNSGSRLVVCLLFCTV